MGKKLPSMRVVVVAVVGLSLAAFTAILLIILYTTMPKMLLQSESRYLVKQLDVVEGLLRSSMHNTYIMAYDLGTWNDAVRFARGDNPDFIQDNWSESSLLETYRFNFVVIRDLDGKVLYKAFYNYAHGRAEDMPPGFDRHLDIISNEVLDMYKSPLNRNLPTEKLGKGGIIFYEGVPYFAAAMPIMHSRGEGSPAGTIILGNILSNEFFRNLTHYETLNFEIIPPDKVKDYSQARIEREGTEKVSSTVAIKDIEGRPALLRMSDTRIIYLEGMRAINTASAFLVLAMLLLGLVIYLFGLRMLLRPAERLYKEISQLGSSGAAASLDTEKYSQSREFAELCTAINDMLQRLDQSRISIGVLQRILNGMDIYLYVTDLQDDSFLFVNSKMAERFCLSDSVEGHTCWSTLRPGSTKRCAFCPKHQLVNDKNKVIVWEDYNPKSGQYLRNVDCLIEWTDKKLVHLHHAADITSIKTAEADLKRRLEQQELMSAMSQTFISTSDTREMVLGALDMAGKFMDVSMIVIFRLNENAAALLSEYEWLNEKKNVRSLGRLEMPFHPETFHYENFIVKKMPYMVYNDTSEEERLAGAQEKGVKSLISIPIYMNNIFWGVITFAECESPRAWTESDIQLCKLIGTTISAAMSRGLTEDKLMRMSSIPHSSPQFISFITPQGQFEFLNEGAQSISGYSEEELKAGGVDRLFSPENAGKIKDKFIPKVMREGRCEFELPLRRKDGEERMLAFSAFRTTATAEGMGIIARDVTEERRLRKELVIAKEQAEQSSVAKSEFLSRMSHEMRTPLNAIIGMTSIAKAAPDIEKKEYCLEKVDDASKHLLGVINDILDMSKIEANKFELSFTEFCFEKMLLRVINVVNFRVDEKNQNLIVHVEPDVPRFIISDEQRLAQVVANLLSNAVKFTPEGGTISVQVSKLDEKDGLCALRVEVTDTGIGIAEEHMDKLFRSFEQADGGIARKFGGTGLGLAISKSIVHLLGGDIWVESEVNKGSNFIFTFKAQKGEAVKSCFRSTANWEKMRLLVVDDAPDVREYFLSFSQSVGLSCAVAANGDEACKLMDENRDTPFNIVFVDWKMPGMDGIELTRRIKDGFGTRVVVIMISATQWSDISDEARAAGVDSFLPKPLFSSMIVDCINESLGLAAYENDSIEEGACSAEDENDIFAGKRVLLAEDIEINREIVTSLLQHTGVSIDSAENGQEAVDMFKANPGRYDMIFMDIHMPEVDGYEATKMIRRLPLPEAGSIPIVAMTANVFREDIERCLASGMDDHVGKPIDISEIIIKMKRFLLRND